MAWSLGHPFPMGHLCLRATMPGEPPLASPPGAPPNTRSTSSKGGHRPARCSATSPRLARSQPRRGSTPSTRTPLTTPSTGDRWRLRGRQDRQDIQGANPTPSIRTRSGVVVEMRLGARRRTPLEEHQLEAQGPRRARLPGGPTRWQATPPCASPTTPSMTWGWTCSANPPLHPPSHSWRCGTEWCHLARAPSLEFRATSPHERKPLRHKPARAPSLAL
mmetsp:Transcript_19102/g.32781  ORF Transcript_19102/g.32781 Transcript_19102/m.32781 type:complete len:219 (-) Transcript_19102:1591-2247(-)